jgi:nitroreductase
MALNKLQSTPISELIRRRYSCRTYKPQAITSEHLSDLTTFSNGCGSGPLGSSLRFLIETAGKEDTNSLKSLGTYGFIKDPAGFVIGVVQDQPHSLEDFGYQMELIILRAVELGIGTCWLGGTFTKSRFAKLIKLKAQETIPSVVSIGYPADQQAWMDRISRTYAGSDRRLPWQDLFFSDTFERPLSEDNTGGYSEPLELLRLAPSASNKQPWRILRQDNLWHFYLQRTKNYPAPFFNVLLGLADLQRIDMGIAMAHFELSADDLGLSGQWEINEPDLPLSKPGLEYSVTWLSEI